MPIGSCLLDPYLSRFLAYTYPPQKNILIPASRFSRIDQTDNDNFPAHVFSTNPISTIRTFRIMFLEVALGIFLDLVWVLWRFVSMVKNIGFTTSLIFPPTLKVVKMKAFSFFEKWTFYCISGFLIKIYALSQSPFPFF